MFPFENKHRFLGLSCSLCMTFAIVQKQIMTMWIFTNVKKTCSILHLNAFCSVCESDEKIMCVCKEIHYYVFV